MEGWGGRRGGERAGRGAEKVVPLTGHLAPAPLQVLSVSQLASDTFCPVSQMHEPRHAQGHTAVNS